MTTRKPDAPPTAGPATKTCAACKEEFLADPSWTDEDAAKEMVEVWGEGARAEEFEVVCEDCYREFLVWMKANEGRA